MRKETAALAAYRGTRAPLEGRLAAHAVRGTRSLRAPLMPAAGHTRRNRTPMSITR